MNKKLVAFLLASSMVFQAGIVSFAAELSNGDSEKNSYSQFRVWRKNSQ